MVVVSTMKVSAWVFISNNVGIGIAAISIMKVSVYGCYIQKCKYRHGCYIQKCIDIGMVVIFKKADTFH